MKIETLKKSYLKRNLIIGIVAVLIISAIILNFTKAKYRTTQSIPLVNGTINYTPYDFKMVAMYQENDNEEYVEIETMPSSGYVINESKSYCTLDGKNKDENALLYTNNNGEHIISNLRKGSKCYLYFELYKLSVKELLLSNYSTVLTRTDFNTSITETTTGTIYKSLDSSQYDDDGEVYYFAGNPTDNWIYFAGFYWRIIKINGNGSIRLLYNGNTTNPSGEKTIIGYSTYNTDYTSKSYFGYKYTSNSGHGYSTDSAIKIKLDDWYKQNLIDYNTHIDNNSGFCNDRTIINGSETGSDSTTYAGNSRYNNHRPSYRCSDERDLFTLSSSNYGNKSLQYPIGLITIDEASFAGYNMVYNSYNFITNNINYYTLTPYDYNPSGNGAQIFVIGNSSSFPIPTASPLYQNFGVRPVINLRADVQLSGSGTTSDPYEVVGT